MITFKNITLKNFLSTGQVTQAIDLHKQDLTLILGENLDLGGDGARNGTGKTTIIQALSYALFGSPINEIRKDNLVNRTNGKAMMVTLEFNVNGVDYKIERGRKPNILKFYVNNDLQKNTDDAQGENKETQHEIEKVIHMSRDMFTHIVALNTYTQPFLSLKANEQRDIIEQLLGITLLSEKAEAIKGLLKETKDSIQHEEFKIKVIEDANKRVREQIESVKRKQKLWLTKHEQDIKTLQESYDELSKIDIDHELLMHKKLVDYNQIVRDYNDIKKLITRAELDLNKEQKVVEKLKTEVEKLKKHECYACGQHIHDEKHDEILKAKQTALREAAMQSISTTGEIETLSLALLEIGEPGPAPKVYYDQESDAVEHRSTMNNILKQLETKKNEIDPYAEQIFEMENTVLQTVSFDEINKLTKIADHQKFLLDMLTSKDSFVRKKIIDQNLSYLNGRLTHYLDKIGLPHTVVFKNDLQTEITELGRELDFDNLSRGERNRLILGLSFAFRDVWESLYTPINTLFIDELIDSGLDTMGVENSIAILKDMSRRRQKSIWLVSHREELAGRVPNVLKVIKENGFTSYNTSVDIE